jgi:hypothetical protein
MPNKGLRKMQAKPPLNITKQLNKKIMSTISNFVNKQSSKEMMLKLSV